VKKLIIVFLVLFVTGSLFAAGQNEADLKEITGLKWEWGAYGDDNRGGNSTIQMEELPNGVYRFTGNVTTKFQYGFAGFYADGLDDYTKNAVKRAKAFSFKVKGDGNFYAGKVKTTDVTDFGFHEKVFKTEAGKETTVTLAVKDLMQPSWAIYKRFNQANAFGLQWQTEMGGKAGTFDITIWDIKLYE
jgi:hypothetical protein